MLYVCVNLKKIMILISRLINTKNKKRILKTLLSCTFFFQTFKQNALKVSTETYKTLYDFY